LVKATTLSQVKVNYCIHIAEMGGILSKLMVRKLGKQKAIPKAMSYRRQIKLRN